ncbi:MAG: phosphotransferase family protein [Streptosporangiaceae bacterium]
MIILTDTYVQPGAPDPVLDEDRVLELARRHAPAAREVTAVDESGGEARAYLCDGDLVVKTQRPHRLRPRTSLEKEAFILGELEAVPGVPVPRVLGYGREPDVEYIVMTRAPGVSLASAGLTGAALVAVLEQVGAVLRRIHEMDQTAMAGSDLSPGDGTGAGLRERLAGMFDALIAGLGDDPRWAGLIDLRGVAARCVAALPAGQPPATLHSNPGPEHCFVDPATGAFTGLIDFGDAYRSHPALDVRAWRSVDDSRHMLAGYRAAGPLPDGFEEVWRAGIVVATLRLAARGRAEPAEIARTVSGILER